MPAHPKNASGPWYVEKGCCITCSIPTDVAPDLFAWDVAADDNWHCFVIRQPRTAAERTTMLEAALVQDAGCIRYRGREPEVLERLDQLGLGELIDPPSK